MIVDYTATTTSTSMVAAIAEELFTFVTDH